MEEAQEKQVEQKPKFGSREWHDFVMSRFESDELFEGNPKVDGLWRVAEDVLGIIKTYTSRVVESPTEKNGFGATVECFISVYVPEIGELVSSGVGDCNFKNADLTYARFPSSLAETRAKGRALRTLLRLRNIVAAEELSTDVPDSDDNELITDTQIDKIDLLCSKLDINVALIIPAVLEEYSYVFKNVRSISKHMAGKVIRRIDSFQNDKKLIKKELKGYSKEWRK